MTKGTNKYKVSFLYATHTTPVGTIATVHAGITAIKAKVVGVGAINRTRPIEAAVTHIAKCAITGAVACNWEL